MNATIHYNGKEYKIDLTQPLDISLPLTGGATNVNSWYLEAPRIAPHQIGGKPGLVSKGAPVNFNDIWFNPHAHVTHTECAGHISKEVFSVNQLLKQYFFKAFVLSIQPEERGADKVITAGQLREHISDKQFSALVLRTLPNNDAKTTRQYSNSNPPYLHHEAAAYLAARGVDHLLVDLPSVDKEKDGGALLAHKAFWNFDGPPRLHATITEFIYVPDGVKDGDYFLNLLPAPFENDASPCRPVLYKIYSE
jgi:kynurenine formamidase